MDAPELPKLELIDLGNLIQKLNSAISKEEAEIELGGFIHKKPKKNPFLYSKFKNKELESRGKYPLIQTFFGMFDLEHEINIGYIFIETGYTTESIDYGGRYETIRLRIKQPLKLIDGGIIPNCSVKLLVESEEWAKPYVDRKNHIRKYDLIWVEEDLSKVLPTEWFLDKSIKDYELDTTKQNNIKIIK